MRLARSREIFAALRRGRPVVALESSVLTQGLPAPHHLEAWRRCEAAVRSAGACPATVAVLRGRIALGLTEAQVSELVGAPGAWKISERDLSVAVSRGASGGTTVSATCAVAAAAGVRVFATGGIGGVHRGAAELFDVSADLFALARAPVAVVCAGAKAVLDLPKTLELLEALSVPVVGVGTKELPGFYSVETGLTLEHSVADAAEAAALARARFALGQGGLVFALPPPAATAMSRAETERHVAAALEAAAAQGVKGKAVTPFLLKELARRSEGRALRANLALLEANAAFAGALAVALAARAPRRRR